MRSSPAFITETGDRSAAFDLLVEWNLMDERVLRGARHAARARGVELERVLLDEYRVPKGALLSALSEYYNCPSVEYDERMPVPSELLRNLDGERLSISRWFPIVREGDLVVIAALDPQDSQTFNEVRDAIRADRYEFRVALDEDIQWFIQDYLHAEPGRLIGTERTGLARWRNTMAHWRTRLACYRNDLAQGRTSLAVLRWGLGIATLGELLLRTGSGPDAAHVLYRLMMLGGLLFALSGLKGYLRVRRERMRRPGHHTLVEVTAATLHFLENYHDLDACTYRPRTKGTMLARLGDCLGGYSTILFPSPASRERTHLARERNVLAAQRTIAATHRTIYARARTGLAFIRTGVAFASLGFGLLKVFGLGLLTLFDGLLIIAGLLVALDGLLWYLPVRKEHAAVPRC